MHLINPQFVAIINAAQAALTVANHLPQTDMVIELEEILRTQILIGVHMIHGTHFGIKKLNKFIDRTNQLIDAFANEEKS